MCNWKPGPRCSPCTIERRNANLLEQRVLQHRIDAALQFRADRTKGAPVPAELQDAARDSRYLRALEHSLASVQVREQKLEQEYFLSPAGMEEYANLCASKPDGHRAYVAIERMRARLLAEANEKRRKHDQARREQKRADEVNGIEPAKPTGTAANFKPRPEWDDRWKSDKYLEGRSTAGLHSVAHAVLSNNVTGAERLLTNIVEKKHADLSTVRMVARSASNARVRQKALTVLAVRQMQAEERKRDRGQDEALPDDAPMVEPRVEEKQHLRDLQTVAYQVLESERYKDDDDSQASRVNAAMAKEITALTLAEDKAKAEPVR